MAKNTYVCYARDEAGMLTRLHDATATLSKPERRETYPHAEPLMGWPEHVVYWPRETGPCVGIAD